MAEVAGSVTQSDGAAGAFLHPRAPSIHHLGQSFPRWFVDFPARNAVAELATLRRVG